MTADLRSADLRHLWHPYTQARDFEDTRFPIIERAEGLYLFDSDGHAALDGISSWWACNLGHSHPRLVEAIRRQAAQLQHSILGGMSHPNAIRLAERLAAIAPKGLRRSFFASDGASAIEAALKIALQYWWNRGRDEKTEFAALEDGYHGDTLGAVGVGFVPGFHAPFRNAIRPAWRAASPHCFHCPHGHRPESCGAECFGSMEEIFRAHGDRLAAVVLEPVCQGAAGMRIYSAEYVRRLRALCDACDVLMIADEIAVGFGRTGALFACDYCGVSPDILCLGKGLTGGHLPMSVAMVREEIFESFRAAPGGATGAERDRTFYHGHTYCGNPIAAAAALAALDVYEDERIVERAHPAMKALAACVERLGRWPGVRDSRAMGMMSALEIRPEAGGADAARRICRRAYSLGLFIRPLGNILYLWPPLIARPADIERMAETMERAMNDER